MVNIAGIALLLVAVTAALLPGKIGAVDHVVGNNMVWGIPSGGPAAYASWASQRTFRVGDTLVFNFATGQHDVAKVTKSAFDSCSATGPVSLVTVGPANFTLNSTGEEHFICTFGQHCSAGQKLAINVTAASTPTPTPAPSPATTPSPSPSPIPSPTPATPSTTPSPTPVPTPTPSPSPSMRPSAPVPSPSGGAGTSPSSSPPTGPITPGTTPSPQAPSDALIPPPAPSSASRNFFASALIMFMPIAISFMW